MKFGRKPKLTAKQLTHAREQAESGEDSHELAALLNVARTTPWRALSWEAA